MGHQDPKGLAGNVTERGESFRQWPPALAGGAVAGRGDSQSEVARRVDVWHSQLEMSLYYSTRNKAGPPVEPAFRPVCDYQLS
jgi:hypothetical protein